MMSLSVPNRRKVVAGSAAAACYGLVGNGLARNVNVNHIVLLGDSIFDNAAYVGSGPDVIHQLRSALPSTWRATLNAVDGATITDVPAQLKPVPPDASHLVVSIGGNDALRAAGVLDERARSVAEALAKLAIVREHFQREYRSMLSNVIDRRMKTAVCTIYDARFPEPQRRRVATAALSMLNDCITREAFTRALSLIDLRLICDSDEDFANAIEPSVLGGAKIARAIARFAMPDGGPRSEVFAR